MPVAISYERWSSKKQSLGESGKRQGAAAVAWIKNHPQYDLTLDRTITDKGRSAYTGRHIEGGELGKLLQAVDDGFIPAGTWLIVESLDRLSREDVWKAQAKLAGLVSMGITVVTTIDNMVYNRQTDIGGIITSVIRMDQAHKQSVEKGQRVRETKIIRVQDAMTTKDVLHQNCPGWLRVTEAATAANRATRRYEKIADRVETVQRIYELALNHGSIYITSTLVREKRQTFGFSGQWSTMYVRKNINEQSTDRTSGDSSRYHKRCVPEGHR